MSLYLVIYDDAIEAVVEAGGVEEVHTTLINDAGSINKFELEFCTNQAYHKEQSPLVEIACNKCFHYNKEFDGCGHKCVQPGKYWEEAALEFFNNNLELSTELLLPVSKKTKKKTQKVIAFLLKKYCKESPPTVLNISEIPSFTIKGGKFHE